jgi:hypothetical protein
MRAIQLFQTRTRSNGKRFAATVRRDAVPRGLIDEPNLWHRITSIEFAPVGADRGLASSTIKAPTIEADFAAGWRRFVTWGNNSI